MNTRNKNYQITRREALCLLATLPTITLSLSTPGSALSSAQYGSALAQCAAGLEACWEMSKSGGMRPTGTYLVPRHAPQAETLVDEGCGFRGVSPALLHGC